MAGILILLLLNAVVFKELHHLLDHDHGEALHCDSDVAHIHSEEYAPVDCLLCFFYFAPGDFQETEFTLQQWPIAEGQSCFSYQLEVRQLFDWHYFLRGPPDLFA